MRGLAAALLLASTPAFALAQSAPSTTGPAASAGAFTSQPGGEDDPTVAEVVVNGRRRPQPGAVVGDIKPELQLSPSDIQSYGVSTVTELLDELAPETRSDRGRGGEAPVVLLNGRRISGFNEIRDIPTEAIARVDILPEEVALKYGYTANQRVVNIVLRRRFRAVTGEGRIGGPTEGGQASGQAQADLLHIRPDDRLNLDLKYAQSSDLTEADRDLIPARPTGLGDPAESGRYRTLLPATRSVSANAVLSRSLALGVAGTVNATLGATSSDSLQGLSLSADDTLTLGQAKPLRQQAEGWTAHLGSTLNRDLGPWRLSLTGAYDHADTRTRSDVDPLLGGAFPGSLTLASGQDRAVALSDTGNVQFLANGPLVKVPAGQLFASLKVGDSQNWFTSSSSRAGLGQAVDLSRNDFNAQVSLDLPLTSRERRVVGAVGDLSLNVNAAMDQLSDFGLLGTVGYGANWTPVKGVSFVVSRTHDQAAPTQQQLGGPSITTSGARVLDFTTGRTVDVTRIDGGNGALIADRRDVLKLGLTLKPLPARDLTISINYVDSRIDNPIQTFPAATAEIEAAFPDRFTRDAAGDLVRIDDRPVNFARQDRQEVRWGFNYSRPLGPQPMPRFRRPPGEDGPRPPGDPASSDGDGPRRRDGAGGFGGFGGGGAGGGGPGGGGRGGPGGRLQFAIYHTVLLEDRMLVRAGGPVLDLLNGSAAGSSGGAPRHEVEAQAGFTLGGIGARLSADWKSATFVRGGAASSTGDLDFSDLATINLRLFDNLGQQRELVQRHPWLRGARITASVTNLLDARVRVTDAAGTTPLSYQSAYLDPAGRVVRIEFRKLFF